MIHLVVKIATPLLLAATGGLVTEIAGTLNIGLEGLMLAGAFSALLGASATGSATAGMLLAAVVGASLAALFVAFAHRLEANIFITGLAINLLAIGVTAVLSSLLFSTQGVIRPVRPFSLAIYRLPLIDELPIIGEIFSRHSLFVPMSWAIALLTGILLKRSRFGLELVATGLSPEVVAIRGARPEYYRAVAVIFSGVTAGLAGAALSLDLGAYVPNMSAGRGWIALVMVLLARKRFWGVVLAALLFASAEYAANALQGTMQISRTLALAVPYLVTLTSMIIFAVLSTQKVARSR